MSAMAKTGTATKKPYQPGPVSRPRGCGMREATPTAMIPA